MSWNSEEEVCDDNTKCKEERRGKVCVGEGDLSSVMLVIKEMLTHELNHMVTDLISM